MQYAQIRMIFNGIGSLEKHSSSRGVGEKVVEFMQFKVDSSISFKL